ncbi:MAG: hypothetical protein K5837_05540 [Candidatus Saccharibacteria bacterium]|nr:hypothetical protein [Candidatus Saccharibacteria bacterium]
MGRKALDFLKVSTPTLEQERDTEMLPHVITAHGAINSAHEAIDEARDNTSKINSAASAHTKALAEKENEEKQRREDFDNILLSASSAKTEIFRRQRAQEIVEREISSRLLTVDTLEEETLAGDSGSGSNILSSDEYGNWVAVLPSQPLKRYLVDLGPGNVTKVVAVAIQ